ncbi:hypothetical protein EG68_00805 [Paragonimus skrjabini miyazakii]|uniref:Innexin n=1 Tax=Paragonimus skrjabini miyazakii TaxID=59628 RepID=A0A8S9Z840_9TREM|nr:hypothetical protein EG68_00805 [Paragonimus skrjabini miyazakii]
MASQQFMDLYQKINVANQVGIEDSVDRLNLFTVVLFALAAVIVGVKQYIMNDISCYIPVSPTGDKFKEFVNDYCWVHGTIPLRLDEAMPNNDEIWNEYDKFRRITNQLTLEDFSDRLTLVTCVLFSLASTVVGVKQYVFNSISCYIPVAPDGQDFKDYLHSYCWVHGTIPLRANESLPKSEEQWDLYDRLRRVNYCWVHGLIPLRPNEQLPTTKDELIAYDKWRRIFNQIGLEDTADRLNLFTVVLFGLAAMVIGVKQYIMNDISCYIPVSPTGDKFKEFVNDYCWVRGTIPLRWNEPMPDSDEIWNEYEQYRRITYYQWVPFVLGLQCIFFYIPHIAWQAVCAHRSGGDLFALVKSAADAATSERGTREKQVKRVAEFLEDMIDGQRDCHKHTVRRRLTRRAYDMCGICVVSKRLGTCLVFSYLGVKVLTIVNAIMQVYLIQRFLGFTSDGSAGQKSMDLGKTFDPKAVSTFSNENENFNGFGFGLTVANHIRSGRDWPETMLFPRVAYCRVPGIRLVGVENTYTAQCALPINMLNEKIYIFFWFWIVFLIVASCISLILWLVRMVIAPKRKDFIKRFLRVKGVLSRATHQQISRSDLDDFIDEYLRRDGVFLIRMLALNAGEVITAEIVTVLYKDYLAHLDQHENGSTSVEDEKAALADGKGNPPSYV